MQFGPNLDLGSLPSKLYYIPGSTPIQKARIVFWVPKLSSHGIYIPNGCKHFKVFLQLFYGNEANSNKPLKNKKISGIERLVLPFPDT